jgi:indole-3-glycerol phosphate synthase
MAASSAARAADARRGVSESVLLEHALSSPPAPALALSPDGFDLIAEVKRRSPAAGDLVRSEEDVVARARAYESAGAACISVLTEPEEFRGDLTDLAAIASSVHVPVMRRTSSSTPIR